MFPQPFDSTFDRTFRVPFQPTETPTIPYDCRSSGVYLTWLTTFGGWAYQLFDGPVSKGRTVSAKKIEQTSLTRSTRRRTTPTKTLRIADLTEELAEYVSSVYESIAVYCIEVDESGSHKVTLVHIDEGSFPEWESRVKRGELEVTINYPGRSSQLL